MDTNCPHSKGLSCWAAVCCGLEPWLESEVRSWGYEDSRWAESRSAGYEGLLWPSFLTSVSLPIRCLFCLLKPKSNTTFFFFLQLFNGSPFSLGSNPNSLACCAEPCMDRSLSVTPHWPQIRFKSYQTSFCSMHKPFSLSFKPLHILFPQPGIPFLHFLPYPHSCYLPWWLILLFWFGSKYPFLQEAFLPSCSEPSKAWHYPALWTCLIVCFHQWTLGSKKQVHVHLVHDYIHKQQLPAWL